MSMTITEKIIAAHAGLSHVEPGEIVTVDVDLGMTNELAAVGAIPLLESLKTKKKFHNPKAAVIVADHYTPARDINAARSLKTIRDYYKPHGAIILEMGYGGIEHVIIPEQGYALPGQIIIAADSHTTTYGALGAFSTGVGTTDLAAVWATGKTWLKVPQTLLVEFRGKRKPWVSGRDFIQYLLGKIGTDGARYRAIEFCGEAVDSLNMADRFTMSNLSVEGGAKNAIFHVDDKTIEYVKRVSEKDFNVYSSDKDAVYSEKLVFDAGDIDLQIALPHSPDNVVAINQAAGIKIDQVIIGSCANGRIEDLRIAAEILRGKTIASTTRCIVIPGSQQVFLQADKEGVIEALLSARCVIAAPTCGPCVGGYMGILGPRETCLSTTTRNYKGRLGDSDSLVYLASPAVAAATALAGEITGPSPG